MHFKQTFQISKANTTVTLGGQKIFDILALVNNFEVNTLMLILYYYCYFNNESNLKNFIPISSSERYYICLQRQRSYESICTL